MLHLNKKKFIHAEIHGGRLQFRLSTSAKMSTCSLVLLPVPMVTHLFDLQELMAEGHSAVQLLLQLHDKLVEDDKLGDNQKSVIFEKIAVSYILPQQACFCSWRSVCFN